MVISSSSACNRQIAGIVTVPGFSGKQVFAAVEDTRAAFPISDLSEFVMSAIGEPDGILEAEIDETKSFDEMSNMTQKAMNKFSDHDDEFSEVSDQYPSHQPHHQILPSIGDHIELYWPLDSQFYAGKATEVTNDGNML